MVCQSEAAEWSVLPSIGVKGLYNDNLLLTPLPHNATYGHWVSPAAEFAGKTERLEASGRVAAVGAIDVERSTIERHRRRGGHSRACREGDENERDELSEVASNAHA